MSSKTGEFLWYVARLKRPQIAPYSAFIFIFLFELGASGCERDQRFKGQQHGDLDANKPKGSVAWSILLRCGLGRFCNLFFFFGFYNFLHLTEICKLQVSALFSYLSFLLPITHRSKK